jgi:hypothetical protein
MRDDVPAVQVDGDESRLEVGGGEDQRARLRGRTRRQRQRSRPGQELPSVHERSTSELEPQVPGARGRG